MSKKNYSTLSNNQLISIIEKFEEKRRYGLVWDNERVPENVVTDCQISLPVLSEVASKEIISDHTSPTHILIEGDNYHALSVLNYTHKNKIDLIYIDPPYNTGEDDFKYNDKFVDKLDGFRHSKWLNFISKRLELAKNLLKETGIIIIHIDENEFINLGSLLQSNVFDENNNLGTIIWNKQNPKGDAKGISTMHEYLFCYAKNKESFLKLDNAITRKKPNAVKILNKARTLYSKIGRKLIPEEVKSVIKPFNYPKSVLVDFIVKYDLKLVNQEFQSWLKKQDFSAGEKAYKYIDQNGEVYRGVSMAWPNKELAPADYFIPLIHPATKKDCPVPARGWRNPPSTMKELLKKDLILFGIDENKQPERKYLLKENMNENTPSIYNYGSSDDDFFSNIGITFPYAKPVEVAKYLISSIHPKAKVILD
ncbi:MAG: site-specific DNA-methyltransferase, partial [Methylotenera sp.]|nr:site-specific DNA-methyltransferase [Methylotenera sp.]